MHNCWLSGDHGEYNDQQLRSGSGISNSSHTQQVRERGTTDLTQHKAEFFPTLSHKKDLFNICYTGVIVGGKSFINLRIFEQVEL
jgi:hypothetical protein